MRILKHQLKDKTKSPPKPQDLPSTHTHFLNQRGLSSRAEAFIFSIAVLPNSIPFIAIKTLSIYNINYYYYVEQLPCQP